MRTRLIMGRQLKTSRMVLRIGSCCCARYNWLSCPYHVHRPDHLPCPCLENLCPLWCPFCARGADNLHERDHEQRRLARACHRISLWISADALDPWVDEVSSLTPSSGRDRGDEEARETARLITCMWIPRKSRLSAMRPSWSAGGLQCLQRYLPPQHCNGRAPCAVRLALTGLKQLLSSVLSLTSSS